jgi:hypothetical protein
MIAKAAAKVTRLILKGLEKNFCKKIKLIELDVLKSFPARKQGDQISLRKKIALNVAQHIFVNIYIIYNKERSGSKMWATSVCSFQKTTQSKHSPTGRKFVQSGHPARKPLVRFLMIKNLSESRQ